MRIKDLKPGTGRDLYGTLECEHCGHTEKLSGGYDNGHWHGRVLPSFHCPACRKNRAGDVPSPETHAANEAVGVWGSPSE